MDDIMELIDYFAHYSQVYCAIVHVLICSLWDQRKFFIPHHTTTAQQNVKHHCQFLEVLPLCLEFHTFRLKYLSKNVKSNSQPNA